MRWLRRLIPGYRRRQEQRAIRAAEQIVREHQQAVERREAIRREMDRLLQEWGPVLRSPRLTRAQQLGLIGALAFQAVMQSHHRR